MPMGTTRDDSTIEEQHRIAIMELIRQGDNSYGAANGSGERVMYLSFPQRFHFLSRDGSPRFCERVGMISSRPFHQGEITRPDLRDA